jgi:hypothetical protein
MKKSSALVIASLLLMLACPAFGSINIFADPQKGQTVYFDTYPGGAGNSGGPYVGHLSNGNVWDTFCVEADGAVEWFVPGATYNVMSTQVKIATASQNTVTDAAKWLYWMYGTNQSAITGTYNGNVYSYTDGYDNRTSLQEAIWHGVIRKADGRTLTDPPNAEPMSDAAWAWYNTAASAVNNAPEFINYVYVVNPGPAPQGYPGYGEAQSMLYAQTPEPVSIIVWSLIATTSYLGVTVWRRQARK